MPCASRRRDGEVGAVPVGPFLPIPREIVDLLAQRSGSVGMRLEIFKSELVHPRMVPMIMKAGRDAA